MKIISLFICLSIGLSAQNQTYEIRATNKGNGIIGVEMRATGSPLNSNNFITDMVFGLKWQSSYNVNLVSQVTTMYNIKKSDARKLKSGYHYQAFFADNVPFPVPGEWSQNSWVEIMRISNTLTGSGTGVFEICEPGFDPTTNPNLGIDLADYTPAINGSASAVVLPVGIIKFDAQPFQKQIKVTWQTTTEVNNKGFTIQRSIDGISFDSVSWIAGKINSYNLSDYLFTDNNVKVNLLYYYRLRQEDVSGKISFSKIKSAEIRKDIETAFRLLPNPAGSFITITYLGNTVIGKVRMKIFDYKGSILIDSEKSIGAGATVNIDISTIPGGQYYLIIEHDKEILYRQAFQKL